MTCYYFRTKGRKKRLIPVLLRSKENTEGSSMLIQREEGYILKRSEINTKKIWHLEIEN